MKTKQAMAKRFVARKGGSIMKRRAGQNHFNSRERGVITKNKRRDVAVAAVDLKTVAIYL